MRLGRSQPLWIFASKQEMGFFIQCVCPCVYDLATYLYISTDPSPSKT